MQIAIPEVTEAKQREHILTDAVNSIYKEASANQFEYAVETVSDAYRELTRLYEAGCPVIQREEVLRSVLDTVYYEAVAEEWETISSIVRKAYRDLSRLTDTRKAA